MDRLRAGEKVVGLKQTRKAVLAHRAGAVYVARDADPWVADPLLELCRSRGVPVISAPSMKELAKACRVEVPTGFAALLIQADGCC